MDLAYQTYKQQLKYTGSTNSQQKSISNNKSRLTSNFENQERETFQTSSGADTKSNLKTTSDFDEHRYSTSSTASSTSSASSSNRLNEYSSPTKENLANNHQQNKIKYTNQDLDFGSYKTKTNNISVKNSSSELVNSSNENNNQKLNLQQRIQQKRHSLSIK